MVEIRKAEFKDAEILCKLINETADFFNRQDDITVTREKLENDGFGSSPQFEAWLLFNDDEAVAFMLYSFLYSCWQGERTLYMQDLFVRPEHRHHGYGKILFRKVAEVAMEEDIKVAWEVERENLKQRHFFSEIGAIDRPQKVGFYLEREDLRILAAGMNIYEEDR